jgi:uncharacterized protein YdeI (YjbR/CyaY-like superfamily)
VHGEQEQKLAFGGLHGKEWRMPDDFPRLQFASQKAWTTWLRRNHQKAPGIWLQFAKKGTGVPSVTYAEAVESALCFGWIDGQVQRMDEVHYLQRFTPRKRDSIWSKINVARAEALIAAGKMSPAGLAAIEAAKANGRWHSAYAGARTATVPEDLAAALRANPEVERAFRALKAQPRYAILFRLQTTKSPALRAEKIAKFVEMLARGEHP